MANKRDRNIMGRITRLNNTVSKLIGDVKKVQDEAVKAELRIRIQTLKSLVNKLAVSK